MKRSLMASGAMALTALILVGCSNEHHGPTLPRAGRQSRRSTSRARRS
jgi:hypothetical protein